MSTFEQIHTLLGNIQIYSTSIHWFIIYFSDFLGSQGNDVVEALAKIWSRQKCNPGSCKLRMKYRCTVSFICTLYQLELLPSEANIINSPFAKSNVHTESLAIWSFLPCPPIKTALLLSVKHMSWPHRPDGTTNKQNDDFNIHDNYFPTDQCNIKC